MKKRKSAFWWLLMIPVQGILSLLIMKAGTLADVASAGNIESGGQGHPAPVFTLLGIMLALFLFFVVTVISLIITFVKANKNKKDQ